MKTQNMEVQTKEKKAKYSRPEINQIKLDNEISMVMQSANPYNDPNESVQPEHFSINPFKLMNL